MSKEEDGPVIEYESKGEEERQLFNGKAKTNPFDLLITAAGASIFIVSLLFDEQAVVWFWPEKGKPHECPVCTQYFVMEMAVLLETKPPSSSLCRSFLEKNSSS
ncbi:unnamed protein product [Malus baccata var. baccata]